VRKLVTKIAEAVRLFSRSKARFATAALAWQDIKKRSGITGKAVPDHSESAWRFRLGSSDAAPKGSSAKVTEKPKARRSSAAKNTSSTKSTSGSPAIAVAIVGVGLAGLLAFRYRGQIKTRFLAKRSVRRSRVALKAAVAPVEVPAAAGQQSSPFQCPGGPDTFNRDPGSFEFPKDTFVSGDGFDIAIRAPISQVGEAGPIAHTAI